MADQQEGNAQAVLFDPSLIPPEAVEYLACETLRLVRWMMTIPKYREAIEALNAARRTARAEGRR